MDDFIDISAATPLEQSPSFFVCPHTLFICALALPTVNAGDDLSDFSNNLATDLGPLLVLFGESITKQYLSESTTFLDYFIFCMAPIGVVTAIISAIRVCGHTSLRAFIGRSQEGDGLVEVELCTSTSRDVCELFTRGGITRVLGRPSILELVYIPRKSGELPGSTNEIPLYLFRHHLESLTDPDTSEWKKQEGHASGTSGAETPFAQNPNLSLNVGIKKQPDWVFYAVAATGFTLQAGLLALAGVGVWILRWSLAGTGSSASRNYAPVMYITGTVLMCTGMWSCAALIGQATQERRYKRESEPPKSGRSHLIWLQPGPQVIGDQSFDPFAYFETTEKDPLRVWTSSRKDFVDFEVYTLLAVVAVAVGYIMQFIGLRGMKAWVSIAHLAITLTMSLLRGCLRMQRLSRNDNKLNEMPDIVAGHELDWISFEIVRQDSPKVPSWHVTGQFENAVIVQSSKSPSKANATAQSKTDLQPVPENRPETKSQLAPTAMLLIYPL
ncbi:uncharacterized protein DNG_06147 [Cephalotrichum gorgonifer]|uniref:Uncharacterized protein n=1 Tax=Cephalotrichum gorgonifer TaxID=2041049 RepID=A0AAE8SWC2_9PEZI|nr:uncharacterized protein DNG_06147 [Cephalotrichum gorgonifer]